jgi:hypothetical protein
MEKVLAFNGDVVEDQLPQPAVLPPRIFQPLPSPVKCWSRAKMLLEFVKDDDLEIFPQVAADEADGAHQHEMVHTRSAVYLSSELVDQFLQERLTPRAVLVKVSSWYVTNDTTEKYKVLLEWLQAACMTSGKVLIQRSSNPTVPLADAQLVAKLLGKAKRDLPGW